MLLHMVTEMESFEDNLFSCIFEKKDEEFLLDALMLNIYGKDSTVPKLMQSSIFQRLVTTENVKVYNFVYFHVVEL